MVRDLVIAAIAAAALAAVVSCALYSGLARVMGDAMDDDSYDYGFGRADIAPTPRASKVG